ncbi:hypothetical protein FRB99_002194, partial [Tulasnella sp. 403]
MSIKAILAYSILFVLNFYIDVLLLFARCLNFMLDQLKDHPPVANNTDKTSAVQDGTISENGSTVVGSTPTVPMDKTSASPIPPIEVQGPSPSPPGPALPSIQMYQDELAT